MNPKIYFLMLLIGALLVAVNYSWSTIKLSRIRRLAWPRPTNVLETK